MSARRRFIAWGHSLGLNAVMFWGAIVAVAATTVAMATPNWVSSDHSDHVGLCRTCNGSVCEKLTFPDNNGDGFKWFDAIRFLVSLALIASVVTLALAIVYTFLHKVNKNVVSTLFIVASWLSALLMIAGFGFFGLAVIIALAIYYDEHDEELTNHFGYSFYFAIAAAVLHIFIGIAGIIQKKKSG